MANVSGSSGKTVRDSVAATVGDDLADRVTQIKEKASDLARSAADKIEERRSTVAAGLDTAASALHDNADRLPGGRVSDVAHGAADRLSTTADYVRANDVNRMGKDVVARIKSHPGPALLVAGVFGFLVGRAISRD
jgi:hypothetical protein